MVEPVTITIRHWPLVIMLLLAITQLAVYLYKRSRYSFLVYKKPKDLPGRDYCYRHEIRFITGEKFVLFSTESLAEIITTVLHNKDAEKELSKLNKNVIDENK